MLFKKYFQDHYFLFTTIILVILVTIISFNRFIIMQDYIVGYEGECDLNVRDCFVGCEDENCTKEYFFSKVQKYAPDLYKECGRDITDCVEASICLASDRECLITYCDLQAGGECESIYSEKTIKNTD